MMSIAPIKIDLKTKNKILEQNFVAKIVKRKSSGREINTRSGKRPKLSIEP